MSLEDLRNLVQVLSFVGIFLVTYQIFIAQRAAVGKNTIDLINFLQATHVRDAQTYVIKKLLADSPFPFGNEEAEQAAATVVSSYDIAAILIREKYVNKKVFTDDFGPSVILCYGKLEEFIDKRQAQAGKRYWNDVGNLVKECKQIHTGKGIDSSSWTGLG
jgi:hypothetical protein